MALRGKPGVSEATRKLVAIQARKLGYRTNSVASLLAKQRHGKFTQKIEKITVGFLCESEFNHKDFIQACAKLDILPVLCVPSKFSSPEAASRILWHRGVSGLLVSDDAMPWSAEQRARFKWDHFSLVKVSRILPDIKCHIIRHSAFDYTTLTLQTAIKHGYRRLAAILMRTDSPLDDDARFGALLNFQQRKAGKDVSIQWHELVADRPWQFTPAIYSWIKDYRPDAIIGYQWSMVYPLLRNGWKIPRDCGMASILATKERIENTPMVSGCDTKTDEMYYRGLGILCELIGRGERGFHSQPMEHIVEPSWVDGETLPPRN